MDGRVCAGDGEGAIVSEDDNAAVTPPEYLAGVRSGVASRDGEVSLLNATMSRN